MCKYYGTDGVWPSRRGQVYPCSSVNVLRLRCSYMRGPTSPTHACRVGQPAGWRTGPLAGAHAARLTCGLSSPERADCDLFSFHVGPGRHVTTCALHAPAVGADQNFNLERCKRKNEYSVLRRGDDLLGPCWAPGLLTIENFLKI